MHFDGLRWAASGAGNVYPYRTPEFPQCFRRILFCCSIISFMHSVLSVLLRFTVHDYPFDLFKHFQKNLRGRRGRDCIVDGFTTTYAIGAYHHWARMPFRTVRARCTALCDKVCQWLVTYRWFSPDTPVLSTNKTDRPDIIEILFKVALNTIKPTKRDKFEV